VHEITTPLTITDVSVSDSGLENILNIWKLVSKGNIEKGDKNFHARYVCFIGF